MFTCAHFSDREIPNDLSAIPVPKQGPAVAVAAEQGLSEFGSVEFKAGICRLYLVVCQVSTNKAMPEYLLIRPDKIIL